MLMALPFSILCCRRVSVGADRNDIRNHHIGSFHDTAPSMAFFNRPVTDIFDLHQDIERCFMAGFNPSEAGR